MRRRSVVAAAAAAALVPRWLRSAADPPGRPSRATLHREHPLAGTIWRLADARRIDTAALAAALRAARYRLLGEVHDNPDHHAIQLEHLRLLAASGARPVLSFEQFDREHDAALQQRLAAGNATAEDVAAAVRFNHSGWNWEHYRPLVEAALEHWLPLRAANLSTAAAARIAREGLQALGTERIAALRMDGV